jgi:hypothetical protein
LSPLESSFGGAIARSRVPWRGTRRSVVRQALRFSTSKGLSFLSRRSSRSSSCSASRFYRLRAGSCSYIPAIGPIAVGALFVLVLAAALP